MHIKAATNHLLQQIGGLKMTEHRVFSENEIPTVFRKGQAESALFPLLGNSIWAAQVKENKIEEPPTELITYHQECAIFFGKT